MQSQVETLEMRITSRDLMEVKDAYNMYETTSVIKWMFEQRYPQKEILLNLGFTSNPCPEEAGSVLVMVKARNK